ncbi:tRNA(Met) cytidine acetyltransferase TmcA [Erwinia sorbitola]|uniref:tRNA(Met) cytidine acetyltransferase TmcA n=1 Tax=Erwinia sorbitola TaxID=2681984 RepID=A0ABW9REI3_9GAMM|nr:GNAT family N-acetyltransferase [Erwinia sorbitola]MTD28594.1 GNAT family N-acetyltransferase [Erwinia sorbitola]
MNEIVTATAQIERQGWRRLLAISGEAAWCAQQAADLMAQLPGDWLWVGSNTPERSLSCAPQAIRTLLGREFRHAVFDARDGFHAEAFAALAGTLCAGSWLVLLLPEWESWAQRPDADSLRWSEGDCPCASTHFVHRFQQLLLADERALLWRQHDHHPISFVAPQPEHWQTDNRGQQAILSELLNAGPGIYALTAARGRGKSALAGMLAARWPGRSLVTAPAKVSTDVLAQYAGERFEFVAPDRLLADAEQLAPGVDWLLIDEAAAIPAPLLQRLVALFPRVLLTTTVQGYEGTGRGFMLKFCASLADVTHFQLDMPLRWAAGDPLEQLVADVLLFDDAVAPPQQSTPHYVSLIQDDWLRQPGRMAAVYQLLTSAHYRTSPLDLRRMMDAPGMHFQVAMQGESVQGALWLVDEGGLSAELATAVWAGKRRPRGNLVAQSLAAHAGSPEAARLRSRRISRIAVSPQLRARGIGRQLIVHGLEYTRGLDFLSVSFGFTPQLWRFWQRCGFHLVRIGSQLEASSGCYTAMALLPLSPAGQQLTASLAERLARNGYWLRQQLDPDGLPLADKFEPELTDDDWLELSGFAWAQRPYEASYAALGRLVSQDGVMLPLLRAALLERRLAADICAGFRFSGRKALLDAWRQEAQQGLAALDAARAETCQQQINSLQ